MVCRKSGNHAMKHPGNHTYTWWIGDRRARPEWNSLAYPKGDTLVGIESDQPVAQSRVSPPWRSQQAAG